MRKFAICLLLAAPLAAQNLSKLVDLTHALDEKTVYWPTGKPFDFRRESWGMSPGGYWYASGSFSASEHLGTHIDSPIHFAKGQATTDQIPLHRLVAPAVVVDISKQSAAGRDYLLSAADIRRWEQSNGTIPAGAVVLVRTGWSRFWPDRKQYMGSDKDGDTANLHFPGIGKDAATLLAERKIAGVGIDTASIDHGPSQDFITHQVLNGAGIYALENVANLDKLPAKGATLIALPMKIRGGTGGPVRIVAALP
jgi:kynurenine formamidase